LDSRKVARLPKLRTVDLRCLLGECTNNLKRKFHCSVVESCPPFKEKKVFQKGVQTNWLIIPLKDETQPNLEKLDKVDLILPLFVADELTYSSWFSRCSGKRSGIDTLVLTPENCTLASRRLTSWRQRCRIRHNN